MVFFITFLRALAACLITNAHYVGVYPTDLIANGGLLGDVLFFAVSGYCLYNVKGSFFKWYGKRLWRVYPPVLIATILFLLLGFESLQGRSLFWWLAYPTCYHFVASILVLYIPFYACMRIDVLKRNLPKVMFGVALIWIVVYCFAYDKTYYHIDTVREPMIRFLFFESMLLGACFRSKDAQVRNRTKWFYPILMLVLLVVYFAGKLLFSKCAGAATWQIFNQFVLLVLLGVIFRTVCGWDANLEKMPKWIKVCVNFVAEITLEIYIVQNVLIAQLKNLCAFPLNWFVLTVSILVSAFLLHLVCKGLYALVDCIVRKLKSKN